MVARIIFYFDSSIICSRRTAPADHGERGHRRPPADNRPHRDRPDLQESQQETRDQPGPAQQDLAST